MTHLRSGFCLLLVAILVGISGFGGELQEDKESWVRVGMAVGSALVGLGFGVDASLGFLEYSPHELSLADTLFVTIPTTIAFTATSALAGWWVADRALALESSFLPSVLLGAGLGAAAGAFVGGVSFPILLSLGTSERIGVSSGVQAPWSILLAVPVGAFWGALAGIPIGAVTVPVISLYMGF